MRLQLMLASALLRTECGVLQCCASRSGTHWRVSVQPPAPLYAFVIFTCASRFSVKTFENVKYPRGTPRKFNPKCFQLTSGSSESSKLKIQKKIKNLKKCVVTASQAAIPCDDDEALTHTPQ
jgi:hypothetical protein